MENKYTNILKKYYSKIVSNYDLELNNIEPQLFPSISTEAGLIYENENKTSCPLTEYIMNTWNEPLRKNIVLLGDGGSGKTTNMLKSYSDLVARGINCVFIPLLLIEGIDASNIEKYFLDSIFRKKDEFDGFLDSIETDGNMYGKPSLVIFLDGYNEVYASKNSLYIDLRKWLSLSGVQIVISTRESLNDIAYLKNKTIEFARLNPLDKKRIISYLNDINFTFDIAQIPSFLYGNPMMLTLYVSVQNYSERFNSNPMLAFRPDCNPGSILWNYMQLQMLKYNELLRGTESFGYEQCNLLAIINGILPYIGWTLEKRQKMILSYEEFGTLVSEAKESNITSCKQKIIECCYENGIYQWDFDEAQIKKIILDKLGFFKKNNDMIQFRHQNYRDFFAAYYYYANIFESKNLLKEHIWGSSLISFDTIRMLCDLLTNVQIEQLAQICDYNNVVKESFSVDNLFQVYNILYKGNLSKISFSNLDLRNTFLNQYKFIEGNHNAYFNMCLLSDSSFYGDGHHGRVITAEYSPNKELIASSCTAGEIKVWQSGNGRKILEINENSNIYALDWINNRELVYGTVSGNCYLYDIVKDHKELLFESVSSGIKTIRFKNGILYVGCLNGDFLQSDLCDLKIVASIHTSIVKIIFIDTGILLLGSNGSLFRYLNNDYSCCQIQLQDYQITDICNFDQNILVCTVDGSIIQWLQNDLCEENLFEPIQLLNKSQFRFTCIRQVDNQIICGTQNGEIIMFEPDNMDYIVFPIEHIGWIRTISYSNEAHELVSGGSDGKLILWDKNTITKKTEKCGIPNMILCHDYIKGSNLLISSSNDCKVIIWDVDKKLKIRELLKHTDWVRCIATGNSTAVFASGGTDGIVNVWTIDDKEKMTVLDECIFQEKTWVMSLDWNNSDTMLLGGMRNGKVYLWKHEAGKYKQNLIYSHESPVHCVRFSPYGKYIASSDQDGFINIYDYNNLFTIKASNQPVRHIRWSEDGKIIFACCLDGNIIQYDFNDGKLKEISRIDSHGARCLDQINGKLLFGGTTFEVWSTDFNESILIDQLHLDNIDFIAHNDDYISSSGHDGNIVIRKRSSLKETSILKLIPIINISGCVFDSCIFENQDMVNVLKMNGAILT